MGLAADAAKTHQFDEKSLRLSLAEIASRSYGDSATVNLALEDGWKRGAAHAMDDGILSQAEEAQFREFRDPLALDSASIDWKAAEQIEHASPDRLTLAALAVDDISPTFIQLSEKWGNWR